MYIVVSQNVLTIAVSKRELRRIKVCKDSPLKCQIREHEENTEAVSDTVGGAGIFSGNCCEARGRDDDPNEAGNVHPATGVDNVMKPSS